MLDVPEIKQALDLAEEAAYTPRKLEESKLTIARKLLSKGYTLEEVIS